MIVTIKASADMEVSEDDLKRLRRAQPGSLLQTMQAQNEIRTQVIAHKDGRPEAEVSYCEREHCYHDEPEEAEEDELEGAGGFDED